MLKPPLLEHTIPDRAYSWTPPVDKGLCGRAGARNETGGFNTFLGVESGHGNKAGSGNVCIGYRAGFNSAGSGNVYIGREAGLSNTISDRLYIANSYFPLIYGEFD
jgi:hypothetical protein